MAAAWHERVKKELGDFAVPCLVSQRWLEFSRDGSAQLSEGEGMIVHVMTRGADGKPRRICELAITREDLLAVLSLIERTPR
jgi:hypothetical protein